MTVYFVVAYNVYTSNQIMTWTPLQWNNQFGCLLLLFNTFYRCLNLNHSKSRSQIKKHYSENTSRKKILKEHGLAKLYFQQCLSLHKIDWSVILFTIAIWDVYFVHTSICHIISPYLFHISCHVTYYSKVIYESAKIYKFLLIGYKLMDFNKSMKYILLRFLIHEDRKNVEFQG
jgi:hypothetical protein